MPGQTAAAHGACRSGGVFPQYSSLWSGVLPRVSENPDGAATRKYFPASRFRRSVMQWGYLNRRMNRFFLARPVFSLMLGAPDRPHDVMTGPGLISLFCFLITAAYFLRGGMCAGIVLCMGLAFFSFSRRGWLRRSVTFLLQVSLLFWGAEAWRLARLWMMEGGPFLLWTSIPAAALLLHAVAILWRRRGEKNLPVPELARSRVFSVSVLLLFLLDALVPLRLLMGERILPWQGANGLAILLLAWWGGYCAEGLLNPQTSPRRRQVMWTVFASAFFLQFLLGVTVAPSLLMTGKLHIPVPFMMISGPVYREEGFFMLALFSVSVLMAGSSWCSHLCYFGVWDCLAAASSRRKGHPVPGGKKACDWRWFSLAAAVGIPLLLSVWGVPLGYALAAAFAVALTAPFAWKKSSENGVREYCSRFCPMGWPPVCWAGCPRGACASGRHAPGACGAPPPAVISPSRAGAGPAAFPGAAPCAATVFPGVRMAL